MGDNGYKEPQGDEPQALYDYCVDAFQAMVFINCLSGAYSKYKAWLENAQAEGIDLYFKQLDQAKDRAVPRMQVIRSP